MTWMQEEGFIRFDSFIKTEAIENAVLTKKVFARLTAPILGEPPITLLRRFVKDMDPSRYQPIIKGILLTDCRYEPNDFM